MKIALKMWRMFGDDILGKFSILLCLTEWMQKDLLDARDQTHNNEYIKRCSRMSNVCNDT